MLELLESRRLLASPAVVAGPTFNPATGHYYYLLASSTWTDAEARAQSLGGHLATINSQAENDWVFSTFSGKAIASNADLWIGLRAPVTNDGSSHAANFRWVNGETATY